MSLADLPNLGPKSSQWLEDAGISSLQELQRLGPVKAFLAVENLGYAPSLNLLWAIEGALSEMPWELIEPSRKESLKHELEKMRHSRR
jgi:DNA transformation protein